MFIDPEPKPLRQSRPTTANSATSRPGSSVRGNIVSSSSRPTSPEPTHQPSLRPYRPRSPRLSVKRRSGGGSSGFFSSQTPRDSLRSERQQVWRKPLHERTPSEKNVLAGQQHQRTESRATTIRPGTSATEQSVGVVEDANEVRLSKPTIRLIGQYGEDSSPTGSENVAERTDAGFPQARHEAPVPIQQDLIHPKSVRDSEQDESGESSFHNYPHVSQQSEATHTESAANPPSASEPGFPGADVSDMHQPANDKFRLDEVQAMLRATPASRADSSTSAFTTLQHLDLPSTTSLSSDTATARGESVRASFAGDASALVHRRENSGATFASDLSTLLGNDSLLSGLNPSELRSYSRLSGGTTLRGTPTPWEQERKERGDNGSDDVGRRPVSLHISQPLDPLPERSPDRQTVKLLASSEKSLSSLPSDSRPETGTTESYLPSIRSSLALDRASTSLDEHRPVVFRTSSESRRRSSSAQRRTLRQTSPTSSARPPTGSSLGRALAAAEGLASSPNFVAYSPESGSGGRPPTGNSLALSLATSQALQSSPNFVAFSPNSSRPSSLRHALREEPSIGSLNSILRYPGAQAAGRPSLQLQSSSDTLRSGHSSCQQGNWHAIPGSSPSTFRSSNASKDTLPPLYMPKKRLRHKAKSNSLGSSDRRSRSTSNMADLDIDTDPYRRHHFSSHLSTIASESVRSDSRQVSSHFSMGSGVLTPDDASMPVSSRWSHRRRSSLPTSTVLDDLLRFEGGQVGRSPMENSSSGDEPGDMTLGIFSDSTAKPDPLRPGNKTNPLQFDRKYNGDLPPLPPVPQDLDENGDTLSELSSPVLRPKRSGYSLRNSNSTPSHSRQLSQISYVSEADERASIASQMFPTWAKHFYSGSAQLLSASKISLSGGPSPQRRPPHTRTESQWTERSITSRLGTGYSHMPDETPSPASSHFLPAIFRPRTRVRNQSAHTPRSSKLRKSAKPSQDSSRPDSLAIFPASVRPSQDTENSTELSRQETLPSGHPMYGALKESSPEIGSSGKGKRPIKKYNKQGQWDEMSYPRPMTKDRVSELSFGVPRLRKRGSPSTFTWQAPSFVDSLDTLFKARGNRQILLFALGFCIPLAWMLASVLPLPPRPQSSEDLEKAIASATAETAGMSEEDIATAMMKHEAGDTERRWREERTFLKAKWWRTLNRVMSVVGILVIGAIIALAVVATT